MSSSPAKWIFFDLDGTLADSISVLYNVYCDFLADFSILGSTKEFAEFNGPSLPEILATLKIRYQLSPEISALSQLYRSKMIKAYEQNVRPMDQAAMLLETLSKADWKIVLVTSSDQELAEKFINTQNWGHYFHSSVYGNQVKKSKPDPEIYHLALNNSGADVTSVIVVEDSINGIKAAKATGARVIGLIGHQDKNSLLQAGADYVVSKLNQVIPIICKEIL